MSVDSITLRLRGPAEVKEPIGDDEEVTLEDAEFEGSTFVEQEVDYTIHISDPQIFHKLMCKRSAAEIADYCLPSKYHIETKLYDNWDVTANLNAKETLEWAEIVANDEDEDMNIYEVLTRWLQTLGNMRVRRALHSKINENPE